MPTRFAAPAFAVLAFAAGLLLGAPARADALDPADVAVETLRLRQAFNHEVRNPVRTDAAREERLVALARAALADSNTTLDRPQLVTVVDRSPRVQSLTVLVADPSGPWRTIGAAPVSTGQAGRFDHYFSPTGVFRLTDAILGYRAEGTLNENGIRGLGAKGSRVWDFGWQVAMKGWAEPPGKPDRTPIRFMLHATDPDRLEQRLGRPASQGCIRISATLNRFLDGHGVLDADYERAAETDIRFRALLLPGRTPSSLAGDLLIVVDSAPSTAPLVAAVRPPAEPRRAGAAPSGAAQGRS